jgi:hypothetical protein
MGHTVSVGNSTFVGLQLWLRRAVAWSVGGDIVGHADAAHVTGPLATRAINRRLILA